MNYDDLYVPPEAVASAVDALRRAKWPTRNAARDRRLAETCSNYERRFGIRVWRAAVRRVLGDPKLSRALDLPAWMPTFRFFQDIESKLYLAELSSLAADWSIEDRMHLREVPFYELSNDEQHELINKALDAEIRRAGL